MIPATQKLYNDQILTEAAKRFGSSMQQTKDLGGFESFVYEIERGDGQQFIMKITHSVRRTKDYLMGELEFVNYLAVNGVQTPAAISSVNGELIEMIEAKEGYFLAYTFEKAEGRLIEVKDWSADLLQEWGRVLGQMHRLTKDFTPSKPKYKRQEWWEDDMFANRRKYIPTDAKHEKALEVMDVLLEQIAALPTAKDGYGLIHGDLHQSNFFINEQKKIIPFDFDDCEYHHFINDIAIVMYHLLQNNKFGFLQKDKKESADFILTNLMEGYLKENTLDDFWLQKLPLFVRKRRALFLSVYHLIWKGKELNENELEWMERLRREVEEEDKLFF
ncbi:MAG: phosphotransferase [Chitinophagales bacterium]